MQPMLKFFDFTNYTSKFDSFALADISPPHDEATDLEVLETKQHHQQHQLFNYSKPVTWQSRNPINPCTLETITDEVELQHSDQPTESFEIISLSQVSFDSFLENSIHGKKAQTDPLAL